MKVRSAAGRVGRLLHTTSYAPAKLVNPRMSCEPGQINHFNQLPPPVPVPARPATITLPKRTSRPSKIERLLLDAVHRIDKSAFASIPKMIEQLNELSGTALNISLDYEPTPSTSRRIDTGAETMSSGIVTIAHVFGDSVHFSTGFVIGKADRPIIATCSHVLQSLAGRPSNPPPSASRNESATFVVTPNMLFPVPRVIASLTDSDIMLLESPRGANLPTLPVSPYPAPAGSKVAAPLATDSGRRWQTGQIIEYKDGMGRSAETGTYDKLAALTVDFIPTPGSSGAPLVDASGAVVGLVRGSTNSYGDRMSRGSVTPAEKIFELFALPGFKPKSQLDRETAEKKSDSS